MGSDVVQGSPKPRSVASFVDIEKPIIEHSEPGLQSPQVNGRRILRKIDLRVVPVLCVLYLLAFLDRVNIANATLFGLKEDLKLQGDQYNTALVIFFVPYIICEIPSNALLKRLKPHLWLSGCMFMFGLTTLLQGFTQNYGGLLATRFFLGVFESGMFPGCFYLLAMWYRREEAQKRYSFFFSSTTLAGAFGGLLASAIGKMDGVRGYRGWRWVFILEGLFTCVVAIVFFFLISDFPEEVKWLTAEEKQFVKDRLYDDVGHSQSDEKITFKSALGVLKDYKVIIGGFMYFGLIVPAYGYAYFAPAIIQSIGNHSSIHTQLLSVPPWACACVLSMVVAIISDYSGHRYIFTLLPTLVALAGFIILLVVHDNNHLQYAALFLASAGSYSAMPIIVCWFNTNLAGHKRRAVATGWQVGFANIGGIIAAYSFVAKDAPKYIPGYSISIAFIVLSMFACVAYLVGIAWENRERDRGNVRGVDLPAEEKQKLGDLNPDYRYIL
ncbi:unnamed protein product [Somion occarium]|uniref:Major facilitator superfamily (MFS) profile domain-containing protein n=1 Tax=Somion occarium TaxID=3059160 RepID=A0ABP1D2T2_9APHY